MKNIRYNSGFFAHSNRMNDEDFENIVSSNECTGGIPTLPQSEEEEQSYGEILPVPKAKRHSRVRNPKKGRHGLKRRML